MGPSKSPKSKTSHDRVELCSFQRAVGGASRPGAGGPSSHSGTPVESWCTEPFEQMPLCGAATKRTGPHSQQRSGVLIKSGALPFSTRLCDSSALTRVESPEHSQAQSCHASEHVEPRSSFTDPTQTQPCSSATGISLRILVLALSYEHWF